VTLCDVGPRDGLQNETTILSPEVRADLVRRLADAGLPRIEAVSFVHPARVPAMDGAEQVLAATDDLHNTELAALVLNERGYDRLARTTATSVHFAFAASETFNRRNQNASTDESLEEFARIVERAHADGRRVAITIGSAFGCPFEGAVSAAVVLRHAERAVSVGANEVVFADTIGVGVPRQVRELVTRGLTLGVPIGVHLHNTRNTGLANAYAAIESGATRLDASVGGVGGCPFAPLATGNIATEDLVYLLHGEGIESGVDLEALCLTATWLGRQLGRELPGLLHRAGDFPAVSCGTLVAEATK
jgi:hydroxymethylglutaryl-CoA lyase/(R)-citramalyl-CoA lyase